MFDIGWDEMLFTAIVAIVVIGPKDLPRALRMAGRWIGKIRRVSGHFRSGIETMIREAELEDMEKKWQEQNAAIMAAHPPAEFGQVPPYESDPPPPESEADAAAPPAADKPKRAPRTAKRPSDQPAPRRARARKPKAQA